MLAELQEAAEYERLLRTVRKIDPHNEEHMADLVADMYDSAELDHISSEMHQHLCNLLAQRQVYGDGPRRFYLP